MMLLATFVMVPTVTLAATLDVTFQTTPLFVNANIAPGDSVLRTVIVGNTGTDLQNVYTSVQNTFSSGLDDVMQLVVSDGVTTYYNGSFSDFFTTSPIALGTLAGGVSRTYTFTASLARTVANAYQSKTFGFDLIIGFEGGESTIDGGSRGGGGGNYLFTIFNELIAGVNNDTNSATLTWNTNRNGSTYLVCGNQIDGPFTLDPRAPLFGYTFDVPEVAVNDVSHSVTLTNLAFGNYECRPVSRPTPSSAFTVGNALNFSLSPAGIVLGDSAVNTGKQPFVSDISTNKTTATPDIPTGSVLGISTSTNSSTPIGNVLGITKTQNDLPLLTSLCILLLLILLVIISFGWSAVEDLIRPTSSYFKPLFFRNAIFTAVYLLALYLGYTYDLLGQYWWVLVVAWVGMTVIDYHSHRYEFPDWSAASRNLFYTVLGVLFLTSYYLFSFPCIWWPFAMIAVVSVTLYLLDKFKK